MASARQQALEANRRQLQQLSGDLRARLGEEAVAIQRPLALADTARSMLRWLAAHPQWIVAAAVVPVLLRPSRALKWGLQLWWGWRTWQRLRPMLAALGRPPVR